MVDKRLLKAVKRDDCEAVDQIINDFGIPLYNESDPVISDDHLIFHVRSFEMFELLLKNGYPLHFRNIKCETIYTIELQKLDINYIECLLKHGQKVDAVMTGLNEYRNISPLHYMIIKSKKNSYMWINIPYIINLLISNHHPINALDRKNRTPLHYISSKRTSSDGYPLTDKKYIKLTKLLLRHGANPLLRDSWGYGQKPSDYIKKQHRSNDKFNDLFNAEKKKITLFELVLTEYDDDFEPKRKIQRIK